MLAGWKIEAARHLQIYVRSQYIKNCSFELSGNSIPKLIKPWKQTSGPYPPPPHSMQIRWVKFEINCKMDTATYILWSWFELPSSQWDYGKPLTLLAFLGIGRWYWQGAFHFFVGGFILSNRRSLFASWAQRSRIHLLDLLFGININLADHSTEFSV